MRRFVSICASSLVLCACGGGGGGSRPIPPAPPPPAYPTLNPLTQAVELKGPAVNTALDTFSGQYALQTGGSVGGTLNSNGSSLSSITLRVANVAGVTFEQTFLVSDLSAIQPYPGVSAVGITGTKVASDGSIRTFTYVTPASLGLTYSALGAWEYSASPGAATTIGGALSTGVETRATDLPTTGTANYNGTMVGTYTNGTPGQTVAATASATADFGVRTVALSTSNTQRTNGGVTFAAPLLDFSGTLVYPAGTNSLVGVVTTTGGLAGGASAKFYGPAAVELGGTFFVGGAGPQQMFGSFGLKK